MRILDVQSATPAEAARLTDHLVEDETVRAAFAASTGAVLFTDRRILLVQREHLLEEKVETTSWPWRAVRHFAIQEGAGGRSTLRVWLGDEPQPLHLRAGPGTDLGPLQRLLAVMLG
jgi:Bacterial PH domain